MTYSEPHIPPPTGDGDAELSTADYLLELSERLMLIPVCHGVDGYDYDRLRAIAHGRDFGDATAKAAPLMFEALENLENDNGHIPDTAWELVKNALIAAGSKKFEGQR